MAKKIIREGNDTRQRKLMFEIGCEKCGCVFTAEEEDTTIFYRCFQYRAVGCPCCDATITNEQGGGATYWKAMGVD